MADILIRGFETPTNGVDCPLNTFGFCNLAQDETHYECVGDSRPKWCPLVPLPERHGRLIDADALQAKFELMENAFAEHGRPYSFAFKDGGEMCAEWWTVQDALSREPTIVPAEGGG